MEIFRRYVQGNVVWRITVPTTWPASGARRRVAAKGHLSAVALAPDSSDQTAYRSGLVRMDASGEDSSQLTPFGRRGAVLVEMLTACVVLVQCTAGHPPPAATPSPAVTPSPSVAAASSSASV